MSELQGEYMINNSVSKLLSDAIFFDQTFLAYSIYTAVRKGIVSLADTEETFYSSDLPFDEIREAMDSDNLMLKRNSIKLFLVKYNLDYAMYLAKDQKEVETMHRKLFRELPERVVNATDKKHIRLYSELTKNIKSFYDIQEQTASFPCYCGLMESKLKKAR